MSSVLIFPFLAVLFSFSNAPPSSSGNTPKKKLGPLAERMKRLLCLHVDVASDLHVNLLAGPDNEQKFQISTSQSDPLAERMKRLLCNDVDADVHFLVGPDGEQQQLFHAHKLILRVASDVFDAMFRFEEGKTKGKNGGGKDFLPAPDEPVPIPDVDVETFKTMLDFIYTDNVGGVNADNLFDVLYAAKKYHLPTLIKACVDIPISQLPNVFIAFDRARFFEQEDLAGRCLAHIDRNADTLLKSDAFLQIDQKLLGEILGRDQLVVDGEIAIWNAALRWADEQCRQKGVDDCSGENRRKMLGPALLQIRFPIIPKAFLEDVVSSRVLTSDELVGVLLYHSTANSPSGGAISKLYPMPFPIRYRSPAQLMLKIVRLSEFSKANNASRRDGETKYIGGFKWRLSAEMNTANGVKYLSLYTQCFAENHGPDWSSRAAVTLRAVSQKQGKSDFTKTFDHVFKQGTTYSWGFAQFRTFEDLMNPQNGWYMEEEDALVLSADVTVKD